MSKWRDQLVTEFSSVFSGATPSTTNPMYWNGEINWITPADLSKLKTRHFDKTERKLSKEGLQSCAANLLPAHSIVMSSRAPIGYFAIGTTEFATNQGCKSFLLKNDQDPDFHYYNFIFNVRKFLRLGSGSTFAEVSKKDIESISFNIPISHSDQLKIARILTTADKAIEQTENAIEKLKKIKQGMMQDLLTRGIDVKTGELRSLYSDAPELYKETEIGWIPKEWDVPTIKESKVEIIDGDRGENYPKQDDFKEQGYCLFLNAGNVTSRGFCFNNNLFITKQKDALLGTGKLIRGDVVITSRGTVGNIAYYDDKILYDHMRINSGMFILRSYDKNLIPEYLFYALRELFFAKGYSKVASGSAQPQLPIKDFNTFFIAKPRSLEQTKILSVAKHFDVRLNNAETSFKKYKLLKQGLMQDLLTGKVEVVPDPQDKEYQEVS